MYIYAVSLCQQRGQKKDTEEGRGIPSETGRLFFVSIRNRCCWHSPNLLSDPFSSSSFQQLRLVLVVAYSSGRRG
jgi:hypothetical protein